MGENGNVKNPSPVIRSVYGMALLISLVAVVAADVLAILLSCCDVPGSVAFNVILEFFEKSTKWELRHSNSWFVAQ